MGKGITLFGQLQVRLPWAVLDQAVAKLRADFKVHRATCRSHFLVLLLAMLCRQRSLREIESGLSGRQTYLRQFGIGSVDRSTLSHANRHRPPEVAEAMYTELLAQAQAVAARHAFRFRGKLVTLDATEIQVSATLFEWARCAPDESGVKLHVFLDHAGLLPSLVEFGTLRSSELAWARQRTYAAGSVLCFDQGYFDTAWFCQLTRQGVRFITRLPPRPCYEVLREQPITPESSVLADEIIRFTSRGCRRNYPQPLRLITFCDPISGDFLWFLTNQLTWSAGTICQIYKARWQIELFFKWLKQQLKLTHFYGCDPNAVRWQVWVALCLYLLLALIKFQSQWAGSLTQLLCRLEHYLFDRVGLDDLLHDNYQFET